MIQDYSNFIGEGFTVDDDIAAIYVRIFKEGGFNKQPGDNDEQFTDFAMWNSLGKETQNWVLEQSKFTGFLGEGYESIDILSIAKLDFLLGSVLDCIDNRISKGGDEDPDYVYTVAYSKPMVGEDGEEYQIFNAGDTDVFNNPFIRSGKNIKWKNRLVTQNLEWIYDEVWDSCVYIKNDNAARSFVNYTGYKYYKNGKRIA